MTKTFSLRESCPVCDSSERTLRFPSTLKSSVAKVDDYVGTNTGYANYHDMYRCSKCQVLYMSPIDSDLANLCSDVIDQDYLTSWEERSHTFREHLEMLKRHIKRGKLLDVGCYAGIFLDEAKKDGFEVTGIEPSKWAASHARTKIGCTIQEGMFDSIEVSGGPYNVITFWDVIEHLANPRDCLKKSHELLAPNGIIAISTHDIESKFARLLGGKYPWLMRFHLVHFSPQTLSQLLEQIGFRVIETIYYRKSLSLHYFLKRLGIKTPQNLLTRKRLSFNTGDMFMVIAIKK